MTSNVFKWAVSAFKPGHFTPSEQSVHNQFIDQSLAEQIEESKRLRLEEIESNADKIVEGKLRTKGKKIKKKNLKRKRESEQDVKEEEKHSSAGEVLSSCLSYPFMIYYIIDSIAYRLNIPQRIADRSLASQSQPS